MGAVPDLDARWISMLVAAAKKAPTVTGTQTVQSIWNEFRSGHARCPSDAAPLALGVTEKDTGKAHHSFRFCCVSCGWSTSPFVVHDGVTAAV